MQAEGDTSALEFFETGGHFIDVGSNMRPVIGRPFKVGVKEFSKIKNEQRYRLDKAEEN